MLPQKVNIYLGIPLAGGNKGLTPSGLSNEDLLFPLPYKYNASSMVGFTWISLRLSYSLFTSHFPFPSVDKITALTFKSTNYPRKICRLIFSTWNLQKLNPIIVFSFLCLVSTSQHKPVTDTGERYWSQWPAQGFISTLERKQHFQTRFLKTALPWYPNQTRILQEKKIIVHFPDKT